MRIFAWVVTAAVVFPVLSFVVEFARAWGLDLMLAIFGTALALLLVDDFVTRQTPTKR